MPVSLTLATEKPHANIRSFKAWNSEHEPPADVSTKLCGVAWVSMAMCDRNSVPMPRPGKSIEQQRRATGISAPCKLVRVPGLEFYGDIAFRLRPGSSLTRGCNLHWRALGDEYFGTHIPGHDAKQRWDQQRYRPPLQTWPRHQ